MRKKKKIPRITFTSNWKEIDYLFNSDRFKNELNIPMG